MNERGGRHGLEEERSQGAQEARVWIPILWSFFLLRFLEDFEENTERIAEYNREFAEFQKKKKKERRWLDSKLGRSGTGNFPLFI